MKATEQDRQRLLNEARRIAGQLRDLGAERVILFGSLARNTHDGASDADVMVIGGDGTIDTGIWDAAERDVDIVPWKADAWARARAQGHPFVLTILREGIELWRAPGVPALDQARGDQA